MLKKAKREKGESLEKANVEVEIYENQANLSVTKSPVASKGEELNVPTLDQVPGSGGIEAPKKGVDLGSNEHATKVDSKDEVPSEEKEENNEEDDSKSSSEDNQEQDENESTSSRNYSPINSSKMKDTVGTPTEPLTKDEKIKMAWKLLEEAYKLQQAERYCRHSIQTLNHGRKVQNGLEVARRGYYRR